MRTFNLKKRKKTRKITGLDPTVIMKLDDTEKRQTVRTEPSEMLENRWKNRRQNQNLLSYPSLSLLSSSLFHSITKPYLLFLNHSKSPSHCQHLISGLYSFGFLQKPSKRYILCSILHNAARVIIKNTNITTLLRCLNFTGSLVFSYVRLFKTVSLMQGPYVRPFKIVYLLL